MGADCGNEPAEYRRKTDNWDLTVKTNCHSGHPVNMNSPSFMMMLDGIKLRLCSGLPLGTESMALYMLSLCFSIVPQLSFHSSPLHVDDMHCRVFRRFLMSYVVSHSCVRRWVSGKRTVPECGSHGLRHLFCCSLIYFW